MSAQILEYRLPTSPKVPRVHGADVAAQWEHVRMFLQRWTTACVPPANADLQLVTGAALPEAAMLAPALEQATRRFGPATTQVGREKVEHTWTLGATDVPLAIEFLSEGEPWTTQGRAYASLAWVAQFRWCDPDTGQLWPGQPDLPLPPGALEGQSTLVFSLGPDGFVSGHLHLPFTSPSESCVAFLRRLLPDLPFAFSPRHLLTAVMSESERRVWERRRLGREAVAALRLALVSKRDDG